MAPKTQNQTKLYHMARKNCNYRQNLFNFINRIDVSDLALARLTW